MPPALRFPVTADISQLDDAMTAAGQRVHDEAEHIEGHFNDINKAAAGMALGVAAAGSALVASVISATTSLAKLGDRSDDLRLPVNLLQSLSVESDRARVPAELLTAALDKFTEVSKNGTEENEKFQKTLGNVGDGFVKAFKDADTQEERLHVISNALKSTTDEVKRAQLSLQAFGTDNERLIGVLGSGAQAFDAYREQAAKLGLEVNESMVKQAQEAKSQLLLLSRVLKDQFSSSVNELIPLLVKMLPALQAIALAAAAVGAVFTTDDTASTQQLKTELDGLVDQWVRLKNAQDDLRNPNKSQADDVRDRLREWLGLTVSNEDEMKALDQQIAKVEARAATVRGLIASKGAKADVGPAFKPRPSLAEDKGRDRFDAAADSIQKRTAALEAETAALDQGTEARERAKIAAQLQAVAMQINKEAGLGENVVTEEQTETINKFADAFGKASAAMENARSPLATFARDSANLGKQLNQFAATSLDNISGGLADIVTGTKSVKDAFTSMANSIINDLAKIAIKQAITGPIAGALKGFFPVTGGASTATADNPLPQGFQGWFADGGTLGAGQWGMAGENGPEPVIGPAQIIPNRIAGGGGAPAKVSVNVVNMAGADVSVGESRQSGGELSIDLIVARSLAKPGAAPARVMRDVYGAQPQMTVR